MADTWPATVPEIQPREFEQIQRLAQTAFGLDLRVGKECLVSARLGRHVRSGGFRSFDDYVRHVKADVSGESLLALIDALTTNHTFFLREPQHFRVLTERIVPQFSRRPLTMWSAACSTGEEPYSLLFTALDARQSHHEVRVVASDISRRALGVAQQGVYSIDRLANVPRAWLQKYFDQQTADKNLWRVKPQYRALVEFRRLNLMEAPPNWLQCPVVFCRNVLIYFNRETQQSVVNRLAGALEPGGYFFIGHAESLTGINHSLRYVQPAVYQRKP